MTEVTLWSFLTGAGGRWGAASAASKEHHVLEPTPVPEVCRVTLDGKSLP